MKGAHGERTYTRTHSPTRPLSHSLASSLTQPFSNSLIHSLKELIHSPVTLSPNTDPSTFQTHPHRYPTAATSHTHTRTHAAPTHKPPTHKHPHTPSSSPSLPFPPTASPPIPTHPLPLNFPSYRHPSNAHTTPTTPNMITRNARPLVS